MKSQARFIEIRPDYIQITDQDRNLVFQAEMPKDKRMNIELKFDSIMIMNDQDYKAHFILDKMVEDKKGMEISPVIQFISPDNKLVIKDMETGVEYPIDLPEKIIMKIRGSLLGL